MKEEKVKFLLEEYSQCFQQMRHYDNIRLSLIKFAFSFYSAIGTIVFAVYNYSNANGMSYSTKIFLDAFLTFTFLVGLIIVSMLTQNRKYFVLVARQVNGIRGTFLSEINRDLRFNFTNLLPTNTSEPKKFNPKSTYTLSILLISLINCIAIIFVVFFFSTNWGLLKYTVLGIMVFILQFIYVKNSLREV